MFASQRRAGCAPPFAGARRRKLGPLASSGHHAGPTLPAWPLPSATLRSTAAATVPRSAQGSRPAGPAIGRAICVASSSAPIVQTDIHDPGLAGSAGPGSEKSNTSAEGCSALVSVGGQPTTGSLRDGHAGATTTRHPARAHLGLDRHRILLCCYNRRRADARRHSPARAGEARDRRTPNCLHPGHLLPDLLFARLEGCDCTNRSNASDQISAFSACQLMPARRPGRKRKHERAAPGRQPLARVHGDSSPTGCPGWDDRNLPSAGHHGSWS